jgi:hypothetical protein
VRAVAIHSSALGQRRTLPSASTILSSPRPSSRIGISIFLRSPTMIQVNAAGWIVAAAFLSWSMVSEVTRLARCWG